MKLIFAAFLALLPSLAWAQAGAPSDCSGTVGTASAAITFGHIPQLYVTITNPATPGTTPNLAVNPTAAAVIGGSGSMPLAPGGYITWAAASGYPPPQVINIIASASSTPYSCKYQ